MEPLIDEIELTQQDIKEKIYVLRGQKVMLDYELANIYGYETRYLNRQVERNINKFPPDFMFLISQEELEEILKCQNVTSSWGGRRKLPRAFSEQGIYMLMTVLSGNKTRFDLANEIHWLALKRISKRE